MRFSSWAIYGLRFVSLGDPLTPLFAVGVAGANEQNGGDNRW